MHHHNYIECHSKSVFHTIFNEIVVLNGYVDSTKFFLYIMLIIKNKKIKALVTSFCFCFIFIFIECALQLQQLFICWEILRRLSKVGLYIDSSSPHV